MANPRLNISKYEATRRKMQVLYATKVEGGTALYRDIERKQYVCTVMREMAAGETWHPSHHLSTVWVSYETKGAQA